MSDTPKHTAMETWVIGAVEAGFPEGTQEEKRRLGVVIIQARAQELRNFSTMLITQNPRNVALQQAARHMIDREHRLEEIALRWAGGGWPPEAGSTKDTQGEPIVRLM